MRSRRCLCSLYPVSDFVRNLGKFGLRAIVQTTCHNAMKGTDKAYLAKQTMVWRIT